MCNYKRHRTSEWINQQNSPGYMRYRYRRQSVLLFWTWFITLNYAAYNISRLWKSFITVCRLHFLNNRCLFIAFCNALDDLGIFFSARCALTSRLRYSSGFNPGNCQHGVINYVHNNNDLMPDQLRMCDFKCSMDSA